MTEDKARERWCPFVRQAYAFGESIAANRDSEGRPDRMGRCIASGCMAWRWHHSAAHGRLTSGYCGLAGKPDLP